MMLTGCGSPGNPFDPKQSEPYLETLRCLDEIVTDFIIETCHAAVEVATYAGRQKLKPSDFEFMLRKDAQKLGHVQTMLERKKEIDNAKKVTNFDDLGGAGGRIGVDDLAALAQEAGEEGTRKGVGRGRGRRKRERESEGDGVDKSEKNSKKARPED